MVKHKTPSAEVGVVVGRFQVPFLHEAHLGLLNLVCEKHPRVIVFLGVSPLRGSKRNPLDYPAREKMIRDVYPDVVVLPLYDHPSDEAWSAILDAEVRRVYPEGDVLLYGGRASFLLHYFGKFQTVELEQTLYVSGTALREEAALRAQNSEAFRAGVIYGVNNQWPRVNAVVDMFVWHPKNDCVLLGRKSTDAEHHWRLPGGFENPEDGSMEAAAVRETIEETGIWLERSDMHYVGSRNIDDWRYRGEKDSVIRAALFAGTYRYGAITAGDDLIAARWAPMEDVMNGGIKIVNAHKPYFFDNGTDRTMAVEARLMLWKRHNGVAL